MSGLQRAGVAVTIAVVTLLVGSSLSRVPALPLRIESLAGEPQPGAYVGFRYKGSRFNFVDSLSYWRGGQMIRADAGARFEIPGFLELHRPFDSGLEPWIEWVYAPQLHHLFGPISRRSKGIEGLMEYDASQGVVKLADLSDDPERWSQSLRRLESVIRRSERPGGPRVHASEAIREELHEHLREELAAFVARHADTPRTFPETNAP